MNRQRRQPKWLLTDIPELPSPSPANFSGAPDTVECHAFWDKFQMPENIRRHSQLVAHIAVTLAQMADRRNIPIDIQAVRASALLHDIAKSWCLEHGGSHAFTGASWMTAELHNFAISQGIILHVHWPWPLPDGNAICCLPILVFYADKRVRHDQCVTLEERFDDLLIRYGKTREAKDNIIASSQQSARIEKALSKALGKELHEDTFNCGWLVF